MGVFTVVCVLTKINVAGGYSDKGVGVLRRHKFLGFEVFKIVFSLDQNTVTDS